MLKKLFAALTGCGKKIMPGAGRTEPRLSGSPCQPASTARGAAPQKPRASTPASSSVSLSQPASSNDSLTNPLNPLSPLDLMNSPDFHRRADAWIESRCEDSHRSSWGSSDSSSCSSSGSSNAE